MKLILIAAMAKNRVIGLRNSIPWRIPEEMAHFKKTTMGHGLIMGRKTFESIGSPLPGRSNVVLTRDPQYRVPGCRMAESFEAATTLCREQEKVFVIGGASIYREAMAMVDSIILTVIDKNYEGDTFFPTIPDTVFSQLSCHRVDATPGFSILTFHRITAL